MKTIQEMDELKKEVGCTDYQMAMCESHAVNIVQTITRINMASNFVNEGVIGKELHKAIVDYQKGLIAESLSEIARYLKLDIKKGESD